MMLATGHAAGRGFHQTYPLIPGPGRGRGQEIILTVPGGARGPVIDTDTRACCLPCGSVRICVCVCEVGRWRWWVAFCIDQDVYTRTYLSLSLSTLTRVTHLSAQ